MAKPQLTVGKLLGSGFTKVGCWEINSEQRLTLSINLPPQPGVYAFAIDRVVQYVGLASTSVRQRVNFYRSPGSTQRTNLRLNEIIRGRIEQGSVVEILIAHPPDHEWKGLKISGAEGLEAGLIREFDLPWNVRGSPKKAEFVPKERKYFRTARDHVLDVVRHRPGLTELEIARVMYGKDGVQQQVNRHCRELIELGLVERGGVGGPGDPYVYVPSNNPSAVMTRMLLRELLGPSESEVTKSE